MSQPQKILHVIDQVDGYGLSRQLAMLAYRQSAAGQPVRVATLRGVRRAVDGLRHAGIKVSTLDRRWHRDPFAAVRLLAARRGDHYDLVHLWGQSSVDYFRAIRAFVPQTPQLITLANADAPCAIEVPQPSAREREELLAELHLPDDAKLIAVGGPLVRSQKIDEAIWHFELVRTLHENVRLLIFGDGPDRHRLERFTRLTSEPTAVRFLGYRSDFRELLSHVDLFWHTATASDALPQTLLEAMAAGVPVVANDTANCRTVIASGNNGYLVPQNDRAIFARYTRKLILDEAHAQSLSESAIAIADRFSVDAMVDIYAERYQQLLA